MNGSGQRRARRAASIAAAAAAGALLVALAVPRTIAAVVQLPARPVIAEVRDGADLDDRLLELAVDSQSAALDIVADGAGYADLGLLRFVLARRAGLADEAGRARLAESVRDHRRALALSPSQGFAWTRLAHGELLRHGLSDRLGPLLALAVATAPYNPNLAAPRLDLCLVAWRRLDAPTRARVDAQIRFVAALRPAALAAIAARRHAVPVVRAALAGDPGLATRFEAAWARHRS